MAAPHTLIDITWPTFTAVEPPPPIGLAEFNGRLTTLRHRLQQANLTHLIVYGDREHFANLTYLTGFDPRFEEALLIIGSQPTPLLIVGNECEGYLPISPLYTAGQLRAELYQPFSLLDQPRNHSRQLHAIFQSEGINSNARVGCIGWKYFSETEHPNAAHAIEIPAYLVDTLRQLASYEQVTNATSLLMNPADGLRTICSPAEIAYFEYTNALASDGMSRMLHSLHPGMRDYDVIQLAQFNGVPLSCHVTFATGSKQTLGLTGPTGETIQRGAPLSTNIAYWGSNSCRAGWIAETASDLPTAAQDYVANFAGPYFETMADWFSLMQIGTSGHTIAQLIADRLPYEKFGIFLNPGHLIHLDEWVSSPIYLGSTLPLRSGMVLQADVIPAHPTYGSTRVEDGIVLADADLRQTLAADYPEMYARCQQRRAFMGNVLGIALPDEVLPLSNIPGIVPPFFLRPEQVFALST